jgi:hypothetical protein
MNAGTLQPSIALIIWSITAALAAALIYRKGHHIAGALVVGVLLGPLALLVALFVPIRNHTPQE